MSLGHEKLDVYQLSIDYVRWVFSCSVNLKGDFRSTKDQWVRASQSIPLNIAEGNGKSTQPDRRRFFEIARGSALECAAVQDVLVACGGLEVKESETQKSSLDRIAIMLSRLGQSSYEIREPSEAYLVNDPEPGLKSE